MPVEFGERNARRKRIKLVSIDGRNTMRMAIVGLSGLLLTVPVSAAENGANDQGAKQAEAPKTNVAPDAKGRRYCVQYEEITGSRIQSVECKTKAAWARLGVDVEHPDKQ